MLAELFAVARESRDERWTERFYAAVPDATLMSFQPQVNAGPDHFPYFDLAVPDPGPVTPFCVSHILDFVLDNGFGIAIFGDSKRSAPPEWVFTYGDLLSFSLYGAFDAGAERRGSTREAAAGAQVLLASPSESYLPGRARKVIARFLREKFQHPDPRVALIAGGQLQPQQNLMINLTLAMYNGDERKLSAALHYLSWFLPRSYGLMPLTAGWSDSNFVPLG
jgi:hypothetical protein